MSKDLIRYDLLVQEALKGVVRKVLTEAGKDGLPGDHHFYVSFRTDFPGAKLSSRLREKYPHEMTIVLQHQFWDLEVDEDGFSVTLSFADQLHRLHVPFSALKVFADPGVEFGLQFTLESEAEVTPLRTGPQAVTGDGEPQPLLGGPAAADKAEVPEGGAEIVSLDRFRRK